MRRYVAALIVFVIFIALLVLPRDTLRHVIGTFHTSSSVTENDVTELRTQLQGAQSLLDAYPSNTFTSLRGNRIVVPVYAYYPFNYQHELLVGGGTDEGVKTDDAVVLGASTSSPGLLIGRVVSVYKTTARVRTIFDPAWRSATRVGTSSVDALLEGGVTPRLTLLPKNATIPAGESVYNSDQQFPYGIGLGTLGPLTDASGGAFREAPLEVPYDINAVRAVIIIPHAEQAH